MFWGLEINSFNPLSMTVERSFHISKAVLVWPSEEQHSSNVDVFINVDHTGKPIQICRFLPNTSESSLDLNISKGENITFSVSACSVVVHLSGYYLDAQENARATRIARADLKMEQLVDICNRILERTYHIN